MLSLQNLCLHSYLSFLETECKTWIDLKRSKSRLLQSVANEILPTLQRHLSSFLSGISSSNTRELMINEILSGKFPSDQYRNCVEGNFEGDTQQLGLFDSFFQLQEDIVRHTKRCVRMCCTGMFIVETMLRVVINDEIRYLILPEDITNKIWNKKQNPYYRGGIEKLVPFNYQALVAKYIEAVEDIPKEDGIPIRSPALRKLDVGNIDTIEKLEKESGHNWKLMKSYNVTREYIDFQKHLAPWKIHQFHDVFQDDSFGVLPTHEYASYILTSMFDFFHPKSIEANVKYTSLREGFQKKCGIFHTSVGWVGLKKSFSTKNMVPKCIKSPKYSFKSNLFFSYGGGVRHSEYF